MLNIIGKMGLALALMLFVVQGLAEAGEAQKQLIERALRKGGVSENGAKRVSETADVAFEAVREYSRGLVPKIGKIRTSTPNPVGPLLTIAANLHTISCFTTQAVIRKARLKLFLQTKFRDLTAQEFALVEKLKSLESALEKACDSTTDKAVEKKPVVNSTGASPVVVSKLEYPDDWSKKDISCFKKCRKQHAIYLSRTKRSIGSMQKILKVQSDKLNGLIKYQADNANIAKAGCSAYFAPLKKQHLYYKRALEDVKENIKQLQKLYQAKVVACIKTCSKRVQITLAQRLPEEKSVGALANVIKINLSIPTLGCQ